MPALAKTRKALSVGEVTRQIRQQLEDRVGSVWVLGEISNLRKQTSGHQYFSLKDESAQLRCVLFKGNKRAQAELKDGMQVQVYGNITVYEAQGQYQLVVRAIQPTGEGELQARFEALKRKLDAEGLFAQERKRKIPRFPRTLILVTSPTGAAVKDMLNVLNRRAPWVKVIVAPVRVQGEGAHEEITRMIERIGAGEIPGLPPVDTMIVGRGGGSIEDLWNFNEENVARAIAACPIPVISGVGHEIDFTIADFVADLRAPTPSAAAEQAVPDRAEVAQYLERARGRMDQKILGSMDHWRKVLDLLARSGAFREPGRVLEDRQQRLDDFGERLDAGQTLTLRKIRERVGNAGRMLELSRPDRILKQRQEWLSMLSQRIDAVPRRRFEEMRRGVASLHSMIRTLGPDSVLNRGYSLTTDAEGEVISSVKGLMPGQALTTRFGDGVVDAEISEVRPHKKARDAE